MCTARLIYTLPHTTKENQAPFVTTLCSAHLHDPLRQRAGVDTDRCRVVEQAVLTLPHERAQARAGVCARTCVCVRACA